MPAAGRLFAIGACVLSWAFGTAGAAARDDADARAVSAVLTRACVRCHGPTRQAGGLRLDESAALRASLRPGDADSSALVRRLRELSADDRMPKDAPALAPSEIAAIARCIDAGAPEIGSACAKDPARDHWAYQPIVRPPVPRVRDHSWVRTPVDAFVLYQLEREGLRPAPPAPPETLVRRLFLDLTGLPPSLTEVDAFVGEAARDPDGAYERLVDRLLASPAYGERWAVPWLDAARYADSNGYEKDERRSIWPYRDWVVNALNTDMPFDRFATWQLAGDLIPLAGDEGRIATGFHRNTMENEEGGVDRQQARWERLVDRAATTATVFLGSTMGCAQCHDHKHDPFSQRDFYALLAHFETADEVKLPLPDAVQLRHLAKLRAARGPLEARLGTWTPELGEAQRAWETRQRALPARWTVLRPTSLESRAGAAVRTAEDSSISVGAGATPDEQIFEAETSLPRMTAVRVEALPDRALPAGGPGRGTDGQFLLGGFVVEIAPRAGGAFVHVPWRAAVSDDRLREEPERYGIATLVAPLGEEDRDTPRGWGVFPVYDGPEKLPRQGVFVAKAPFGFLAGSRMRIRMLYSGAAAGETIGRLRVSVTGDDAPEEIAAVSARMRQVIFTDEAARTRPVRDELAAAFRGVTPLLSVERARLVELARAQDALGIVSTLSMAPHPGARAETPLRLGGSFARPAELVPAAPPGAFAPHNKGSSTRLDLARWLFSPENPLTARVAVNRLWAGHLGRGIVETIEDFGTQGAPPSHPQLLDWLADEFRVRGFQQKAVHRLIVMSSVYRQSSAVPAAHRARDPDGRLLSYAPRLRLDAEAVRDLALAASGLLDDRRGGPPVYPPQPTDDWARPNSRDVTYPTSSGGDAHRRALYTFWRRTAPYPTAALFDAPSRETCTMRRPRARTPLQALATLNDPVFWEAAVALGRRMLDEPPAGASLDERLTHGFRLSTGRTPRPAELRPLRALWTRTAAAGDPRHAFSLVGNVLLNLDETLTRG